MLHWPISPGQGKRRGFPAASEAENRGPGALTFPPAPPWQKGVTPTFQFPLGPTSSEAERCRRAAKVL